MTLDQWLALGGVLATWTALVGGFFYRVDTKRAEALASIRSDLRDAVARATAEHAALRTQMVSEHHAITASVEDMARTVRDEYVHRREFDISMRNLDAGVTEARSEIGTVGVQVGKVHERIDRLIDRRSQADG